jgi:hypothetical protein
MRSTGIGPANIRAANRVTAARGDQAVQPLPVVVLTRAAAEIDRGELCEPGADGDIVEPVNFGRRQAPPASRGAVGFGGVAVLSPLAAERVRAS